MSEYISDDTKGIGNPYETTRIDQIHRDGSVIPTEIVTSFLRNSDGEITRILGSSRNISDRVVIEEQLKKSEHHFRLLVETTKYTLTVIDPVTLLHGYVSPSIFNILGYTPEEFVKIPFYQIIHPSQSEWVKEMGVIRLAEFQSNPNSNKFYMDEYQLIAKNGSMVWVESTFRFIVNEEPASRKLSEFQGILRKKRKKEFSYEGFGNHQLRVEFFAFLSNEKTAGTRWL